MTKHWTFGKRLGMAFSAAALHTLVIGVVAVLALLAVVDAKDGVVEGAARMLTEARALDAAIERKVSESRGFP
ncbi:MAG: hypothetical protein FJW23_02120 [Acidimicrobiia bacterium]|nr:hypothetical protein [Acidimicrobiia bacterium]